MADSDNPVEVQALRKEITDFLARRLESGKRLGAVKHGVYAFYDYDGEPIYVGQTSESLGTRIRRHLTNQRTDAVAMSVLDPFEVADIEAWPIEEEPAGGFKAYLNGAEYTVFQAALEKSQFKAVLNEKAVGITEPVDLPPSYRHRIVPWELFEIRKHSDIRIARRASTIAGLARVISERNPSKRLRVVLLTQARRLEVLARQRLGELGIEPRPGERFDDDDEDDG
jgi:hypothetical protein